MNDTTYNPTTPSLRGIASLFISLSGFTLVWYETNWFVALGLFAVLIANNMAHSVQLLGE